MHKTVQNDEYTAGGGQPPAFFYLLWTEEDKNLPSDKKILLFSVTENQNILVNVSRNFALRELSE